MYYVLGGNGFVGSAICSRLSDEGELFTVINRENYADHMDTECDVFVNCDGNSRRFWANENPASDFEASVLTTMDSLHHFKYGLYIFMSSVDVYSNTSEPSLNKEDSQIEIDKLTVYGFHKWIAEGLVRRYASKWLILRLGNLVGPGLKKNPVYDALTTGLTWTSKDSQYNLIHTRDMALALYRMVSKSKTNEIVNVCGTGTVRMRDISKYADKDIMKAPGADKTSQIYNVNNDRLKNLISVSTSKQTLRDFVHESGRRSHRHRSDIDSENRD